MHLSLLLIFQLIIFCLGTICAGLLYFWVDPTQNSHLFLFFMCSALFLSMSTSMSLVSYVFLNILRRGYIFFLDVTRILRRSTFLVMFLFCVYFFDRSDVLGFLSFSLIAIVFVLLELVFTKLETSGGTTFSQTPSASK